MQLRADTEFLNPTKAHTLGSWDQLRYDDPRLSAKENFEAHTKTKFRRKLNLNQDHSEPGDHRNA